MPKLLMKYYGRVLMVESKGTMEEGEWSWREIFIGLRGVIYVYESEKKYPGKSFIYIKGTDAYLRTGAGEVTQDGDILTISTKNSIYKFLILGKSLLGENEKEEKQDGDS